MIIGVIDEPISLVYLYVNYVSTSLIIDWSMLYTDRSRTFRPRSVYGLDQYARKNVMWRDIDFYFVHLL